jgi:hypothetical protein
LALLLLFKKFRGAFKYALSLAILGGAAYVFFMITVDVPMYFLRWSTDLAVGKSYFGLTDGLWHLSHDWTVTHDINDWRAEIPWMSLYFSVAVWTSLALCYIPLNQSGMNEYINER